MNWGRHLGARGLAALAMLSAFIFSAPPADAASVVIPIQVGARVDVRCTFLATPMPFGRIAGGSTVDVDAEAMLTIDCDFGRTVTIRMDEGLNPGPGSTPADPVRRMTNGLSAYLEYNMYTDAARTDVWGDRRPGVMAPRIYPSTMTVYGRVFAGQSPPVGNYSDTVMASMYF